MRTRRGHIQPRIRYFVGCEGESEQSYVQVLQRLCDTQGRHVHLNAEPLRGGDALARLEIIERQMQRYERRGTFAAKFALLDADQRVLAPERAAQADRLAASLGVTVIWQQPCHEALLASHFANAHRNPGSAEDALQYLQSLWPEYRKAMTARQVSQRIDFDGITRASGQNPELGRMLSAIGLVPDKSAEG